MAIPQSGADVSGTASLPAPRGRAQEQAPPGCSPDLNPLCYSLCDRSEGLGHHLGSRGGGRRRHHLRLTIILVASLPFMPDTKKRSLLGTQVFFLLGTLGLFCLRLRLSW